MLKLIKWNFMLILFGALALNSTSQAIEPIEGDVLDTEMLYWLQLNDTQTLNLIDWKVGDTMTHQISMGSFGKMGKSVKKVSQDTGATIWVRTDMDLQFQKEQIDIEINKADGKILKMKRNGQDQEIPNDPIEVISQEGTSIRVPAGTFDCVHIVAKTKQISRIEVWANPRDTAMDGTLKQAVTTQFGVMTLELMSFSRN